MNVIAFVDIHPPHADRGTATACSCSSFGHLLPNTLGVEVGQFYASRCLHKVVSENLAGEVVLEDTAVSLGCSTHLSLDLGVIILRLDSVAAVLQDAVLFHLVADAFEDRSAQLSRVLCCFTRNPS
jgi:hypothetical protein